LAALLEQRDTGSTEINLEFDEAMGAGSSAVAGSSAGAADALSEAAGSSVSGSKHKAGATHGGDKASFNEGVAFGCSRQREDDYYGVCHTDVVKCIVVTDAGKIFTAGWVVGRPCFIWPCIDVRWAAAWWQHVIICGNMLLGIIYLLPVHGSCISWVIMCTGRTPPSVHQAAPTMTCHSHRVFEPLPAQHTTVQGSITCPAGLFADMLQLPLNA
jgi:hypothetical protein